MMGIPLRQVLGLVGKLDDASGEGSAKERFRRYLKENVKEVGQLRDYVDECLRNSDDQSNRALQDLVNHLGTFLGFEVEFGRYRGVQNKVGFDGYWKSPTGFHVVIEVKTSETYTVKTTTLVGYVDGLISDKRIPNWDKAMGLYVVGRYDPEIRQLENSIRGENRTSELRLLSVASLLSLAEMMNDYDVTHQDALAILRPSGPPIDPVVDLMTRLVRPEDTEQAAQIIEVTPEPTTASAVSEAKGEVAYWLAPVKSDEAESARDCIKRMVGQGKLWGMGERTPGRKHMKPGDWMCFYEAGTGVVAHARIASTARNEKNSKVRSPERYPWVLDLDSPNLYLDKPVVLDPVLRSKLNAFEGKDPAKPWSWFVFAMSKLSPHDYKLLTRGAGLEGPSS